MAIYKPKGGEGGRVGLFGYTIGADYGTHIEYVKL